MAAWTNDDSHLDVDDDAGPGTNALLGFRPEQDGEYILRVKSFGSGGVGRYRLRISDELTPPPPLSPGVDDEHGDHEHP